MKILKYINQCFFWSFVISLFMMIWFDEPAIGKTCVTSVLGVVIMSMVIGRIKTKQAKRDDEDMIKNVKTGITLDTYPSKSGFKQRLEEAQKAKSNKRDY